MVTVPTLDRLTRMDVADRADPIRAMAIWQELCEEIEAAFTEIIADQVTIAAVQTALDGKNTIFRQTTAPTATATGDLWLDSDDGDKPYRWSGTAWVVVQDVGAAYARLGVNSDGTIATNKVLTASILANAVSNTGFAFTATSTLISTSYSDVQSLAVTADGVTPVNVAFGLAFYWGTDNGRGEFALYRGTTALVTFDPNTINSTENPVFSSEYSDTPAAGTYTYYLKAKANNIDKIGVKNRFIRQMELMR